MRRAAILASALLVPALRAAAFDTGTATAEEWRRELAFTPEQSRRFEQAGESRARSVEPLKERLRAALARVRELSEAKADEASIAEALGELNRLRAAIQRENARYDEDLASFLSPSQRARLLMLLQGARPALRPVLDSRS